MMIKQSLTTYAQTIKMQQSQKIDELEDAVYWCYSNLTALRGRSNRRYEFVYIPRTLGHVLECECSNVLKQWHMTRYETLISELHEDAVSQTGADRVRALAFINAVIQSYERSVQNHLLLVSQQQKDAVRKQRSEDNLTWNTTMHDNQNQKVADASTVSATTTTPPSTTEVDDVYIIMLTENDQTSCQLDRLISTVRARVCSAYDTALKMQCEGLYEHIAAMYSTGLRSALCVVTS
jgi:hypothetical protein